MKTVTVLGSSGMLGRVLVRLLCDSLEYRVNGLDITEDDLCPGALIFHQIDFRDLRALESLLSDLDSHIIVNCAAIVSLKVCEENRELATLIHRDVSRLAAKMSQRIIYISTDSVFDGSKGSYSEDSKINPLNFYAQSKQMGEIETSRNENSLILRTNIYGFKREGGASLFEWGCNSLLEKKPISGYTNVIFNPLSVYQLSEAICELMESDVRGILNAGSERPISKYSFLRKISGILKTDENLVSKSVMEKSGLIDRPENTSLDITKLNGVLNRSYNLDDGLRKVAELYLGERE